MSKNLAKFLFAVLLFIAGCAAIYLGLVDPSQGVPLGGGEKTFLIFGGVVAILLSVMHIEELK